MFLNQVKSTGAVLSVLGVAVISAPPAWADNGQGRPQASPVQKAENLIRPAVVYLEEKLSAYVGNDKGWFNDLNQPVKMGFRCTGFVVNPAGYVATAGHCVDPGAEGARGDIIKAIAEQDAQKDPTIDPNKLFDFGMANWKVEGAVGGSPIDQTFAVLRGGANGDKPQSLPARLVDFRPVSQGDVALLKVEASDVASSELATDTDVQVGQQIISVGYPGSTDQITDESMDPDNKDGTVSAKKTAGSVPVYETNAALSGGMSGGPTVGLDGRVVGINSRGPAGETQPFNFIAPAAALAELLNRNGVKAQLGPLDLQFRNGLNDYYAGHYTSAIATFDKILALAPSYQQAAVFKTNAARARDQYGDVATSSGSKTILYVVGGLGGALLVIAAVVATMMIRRRGNRPLTQPAGAPPVFTGPTYGPPPTSGPLPVFNPAGPPDATSGPMPVFNPAGPPTAWSGSQSPTASVEQTGPPRVGAEDHPPVTAPTVTAPATFDSSTERADRAGGNGQTTTSEGAKLEQLKTLAALRDSGALTEAEFEAEKRKILDGR
jgi:serine protease Do